MRGADITQESLFTVAKLDDFVPATHPLRAIRKLADTALQRMSALFDTLYADTGRASIAPETLMRAQLLQLFYSLRSERMLMEQLGYNLLFRWFVGLAIDDPVWDHSVFSKNRDRLNAQAVATEFLSEVVRLAEKQGLISGEHFSVDGTLLQAWPLRRVSGPRTTLQTIKAPDHAMPSRTSRGTSAATTPTPRPAIRMPGCTERATTPARS